GIVAADLQDPDSPFQLGDIYQDGKKVGNLLDASSGYTSLEAWQILAQLMPGISTKEYNASFVGIRKPADLERRVREEAVKYGVMARNAEAQQKFREDVEQIKGEWDGAATGWAAFGAGFAGGATLGAAGFMGGPVLGTITTIGGGLVGGFGALLNRDTLADQAAQSIARVRMAEETGDGMLAAGARLEAVGQGLTMSISPLQNWVQGLADYNLGDGPDSIGDGIGYYDYEDKGLWEAANMAALFGDSLLQFASPWGRGAYMTSMGFTATGRTGQYTADLLSDDDNVGLWDPARARFDGADDFGQTLGAAGEVGIDFFQLGVGSFMGRIARGGVGPGSQLINRVATEKLGHTKLGQWMQKVGEQGTYSSLRFAPNPAGGYRLVGVAPTILIPSETVTALNALLR